MAIFRLELEKTIVTLDFSIFNLSKCNISCKKKKIRCRIKNCFIWVFLVWKSKKQLYCGILNQQPQIFANTKFRSKIKTLKFGTKIVLIEYFGLEFQKANVVFEISIKIVNTQSFIQKQKKTLGLKYLGIFWLQFNKNYY